jgi:[protein-PII] uridylyltransferase
MVSEQIAPSVVCNEYGTADRGELLQCLKGEIDEVRKKAADRLAASQDGRRCACYLSSSQDRIIRIIHNFALAQVRITDGYVQDESMAIIATGGYGRGLLAPGSDIDLLFLISGTQTSPSQGVIEFILYMLWDMGFKVGHASRSIKQCVNAARDDMIIRTSMLDARLVSGEVSLYTKLQRHLRSEVMDGTAREFIAAKLDERRERSTSSRYLVEPDIKDGKGGLRDLHTLYWIIKYIYPEKKISDWGDGEVFSAEEYATFCRCGDFLWTVRCHMHFLNNKPEERLSFGLQTAMAESMGYKEHDGLRAVEYFMQDYFMTAKDVGDLTRTVCQMLEMKELKDTPVLSRIKDIIPWTEARKKALDDSFVVENGRINIIDDNVFARDPVNFIRFFLLSEETGYMLHPHALRRIRASLYLIGDELRNNTLANDLFLELLVSGNGEEVLRKMNESGVLGRFIPDFGRIDCMMQFNMYHHYTVDEHLIRAVGLLSRIEIGKLTAEHPLSAELFPAIKNVRVLYMAVFLHDIAKGRKQDHSVAGAEVARNLCQRFGFSRSETQTVAWLVENHLIMSKFAQSRDISDRKTIHDFANIVQEYERLKLLLILTVVDIRAVGKGVWNGWKGQLLRNLYYETEPVLTGGYSEFPRTGQIAAIKSGLRDELCSADTGANTDVDAVEEYLARFGNDYWLGNEPEKLLEHAHLILNAEKQAKEVVFNITSDKFTGITELTVYGRDKPHMFAMVAGAAASSGGNIMTAQATTTNDGMALVTIGLRREFDMGADEHRRADSIGRKTIELLSGGGELNKLLNTITGRPRMQRAFSVDPQVVIDNEMSEKFTVIETTGLDRPGLLYHLTRCMADSGLNISSAHIATFGEKAVDVFYVTATDGQKLTDPSTQNKINVRLYTALSA